jgi:hypothetical protein
MLRKFFSLLAIIFVSVSLFAHSANATTIGDTLASGASLPKGDCLVSTNSQYTFCFQEDGNVVLYQGSKALWANGNNGKAAKQLIMQTDGNLVEYNYAGNAIWATGTNGKRGGYLIMQNDGNAVIYYPTPSWATGTNQ